jgi:chromosome segregation protein
VRLTKLELLGFKSFADDTEMLFEPGVTAVVGPNGCGKSNVSDAVRWVLGEQRPRALRGAKMEEVIFQGSSARRPVNIAEVSLHFENDDGALAVPFREVVITRRLSRSGESEYFVNRAPCRLRDIHDMVRGTGLGADSGVVIESKMIDALLSDRPDERRELFEEAAGIGLYRDRKRTAERRLEETTVDLSRIDDLISEVQTQVRSLARQRRRAEKHTELMSRRFTVEIALAAREMDAWRDELARLEIRVAELRSLVPAADEAVAAAEAARDAAHGARAAAEAKRNELARLVSDQSSSTQQLRAEIAVAEERQRNAMSRRQRAEMEREEGDHTVGKVTDDLQQAIAHREQLETEMESAQTALTARVAEEESVRAALAAARAAVESADRAARDLREKAHRHDLDRLGAQRELEELAARRTTLIEEHSQLTDSENAVRRELTDAEEGLAASRQRTAECNATLATALGALRAAREEDSASRSALLRAEETFTALDAKVNALEALERERVGLAPAAAKLLDERERFGDGAIIGPLSDFISADTDTAALVERYLGATVHAVLVRDRAAADAVRAWHSDANPGSLLLLPVDAALDENHSTNGDQEDLSWMVKTQSDASRWVRALLGRVKSIENGTGFIDSRGAIWLPAKFSGPGPIRRRAEIAESREQLEAANSARDRARRAADSARAALESAERAAQLAQEAAAEASRESAEFEDLFTGISRRHHRAARELTDATSLLERLASREMTLNESVAQIELAAAELVAATASHDTALADMRRQLAETETRQDAALDERTASQVACAQAQARLQVAMDRERHLRDEYATVAARLESLQSESACDRRARGRAETIGVSVDAARRSHRCSAFTTAGDS